MMAKTIIDSGVKTQYVQNIVLLSNRSYASDSPDVLCVICASVKAGGEAMSSTVDTTNTGLYGSCISQSTLRRQTRTMEGILVQYLLQAECSRNLYEGHEQQWRDDHP